MLAEHGRKEQGSVYRGEEGFRGLVMINKGNWTADVSSGA